MPTLVKLAWPIQIAVFVLLLVFLPNSACRIFILLGYILGSSALIRSIKRT